MEDIISGIKTSLVDKNYDSKIFYQHLLIKNDQNHSMLHILKKLLLECDEFYINVAFITNSGVQSLFKALHDVSNRGVKGKIVTGNYQYFSNPKAIERLNDFSNIDIRVDFENKLHSKGYFFKIGNEWKIIIGSSNMTISAFSRNTEWNLLLTSTSDGKLIDEALDSFYQLYDNSLQWEKCRDDYIEFFNQKKQYSKKFKTMINNVIKPNKMQKEALNALSLLRSEGNRKAILISATGSGKTYLSAFDVKAFNPKRCLFIVHRSTILNSAMDTFASVITNKSMGLYNGECKDSTSDFIFANIATLSRDNNLYQFNKDEFDYTIIDEVHKSGAQTYQKVLDYFTPSFLLGMSATPERTDGYNIFNLFDNNIAYEIRLKEAIEQEMIVPFHYYGVSDICDEKGNPVEFNSLSYDRRVENIIEKSNLYGYDGDRVRGLIFINNIEEAKALEKSLNKRGVKSLALTGSNTQREREEAICKLETDSSNDYLDFIITVDVFNEGVDIPSVNQVILMRPTLSSIIYTQQIGRGLRLNEDKEYLVIIDFIANYEKNFLIPMALTGDSSFNLDKLKEIVVSGNGSLLDNCTIEFEKIPSEYILNNISKKLKRGSSNFKKAFINDFKQLEFRLNRMPLLSDFYDFNLITPEVVLNINEKQEKKTVRGYHYLLQNIFNYDLELCSSAMFYLEYLYSEFGALKRIHETVILKLLLKSDYSEDEIITYIEQQYNISDQKENVINALEHLSDNQFKVDMQRRTFRKSGNLELIVLGGKVSLNSQLKKLYRENQNFKILIDDLLTFNLKFVNDKYLQTTKCALKLFGEYRRKEIFHIVNDDYNVGVAISGYRYIKNSNTTLIFSKFDQSSYENILLSENLFEWISKTNRVYSKSKLETKIANNETTIKVFLRRGEGDNYTYVGEAETGNFVQDTLDNKPIIKYDLRLKNEIKETLYKYLTGEF